MEKDNLMRKSTDLLFSYSSVIRDPFHRIYRKSGSKGVRLGFTLIEIVIVVAIISASFTIVTAVVRGNKKNAVLMECTQIAEAMNEYRINNGSYPANFQSFLQDPNYFKDKLTNPYGNGFGMIDNGTTITIYAEPLSNGISYTFTKSQMGVTH